MSPTPGTRSVPGIALPRRSRIAVPGRDVLLRVPTFFFPGQTAELR
ncbi:MAG: hypothetical protein LBQ51_11290 [Desulfovibrio sp.]|nr:hypothetical protein [Desulfovibrio sp.]